MFCLCLGVWRLCTSLALSFVLLQSILAAPPQTAAASPQAVILLQKSLAAMVGNVSLSDITLTGTAHRIAASDDETGSATLKAAVNGSSHLDFNFSPGPSTEVSNLFAAVPVGSGQGLTTSPTLSRFTTSSLNRLGFLWALPSHAGSQLLLCPAGTSFVANYIAHEDLKGPGGRACLDLANRFLVRRRRVCHLDRVEEVAGRGRDWEVVWLDVGNRYSLHDVVQGEKEEKEKGMRVSLLVIVALLMTATVATAQHRHESVPIKEIDGSEHPELIPDLQAYGNFFNLRSVSADVPNESEEVRGRLAHEREVLNFKIRAMGLAGQDDLVFRTEMIRYRARFDALVLSHTKLAEKGLVDSRPFNAEWAKIVSDARGRLEKNLSTIGQRQFEGAVLYMRRSTRFWTSDGGAQ
jgi:hypothetical protein